MSIGMSARVENSGSAVSVRRGPRRKVFNHYKSRKDKSKGMSNVSDSKEQQIEPGTVYYLCLHLEVVQGILVVNHSMSAVSTCRILENFQHL